MSSSHMTTTQNHITTTPFYSTSTSTLKPKSKTPFGFSLNHPNSNPAPSKHTLISSKKPSLKFGKRKDKDKDEDEDYIPYNGPYEAPRPTLRKERVRDSWGDFVDGGSEDEEEPGVAVRAGEYGGSAVGHADNDERVGRTRDRSFSVFSGKSGGRGNQGGGGAAAGQRRSTVSGGVNPQHPQYHQQHHGNTTLTLATPGVGASPVPREREGSSHHHNEQGTGYRMSLASLFSTFGVGHRDRGKEGEKDRAGEKGWERGGDDDTSVYQSRKSSGLASLPRISTTFSGGSRGLDSALSHRGGADSYSASQRGGMESVSPWGEDSEDLDSPWSYSRSKTRNAGGGMSAVDKVYLPPDSEPDWGRSGSRIGGTGVGGAGKPEDNDQHNDYYDSFYSSPAKEDQHGHQPGQRHHSEHGHGQRHQQPRNSKTPYQKSALQFSYSSPGGGAGGGAGAALIRDASTSTEGGSVMHTHSSHRPPHNQNQAHLHPHQNQQHSHLHQNQPSQQPQHQQPHPYATASAVMGGFSREITGYPTPTGQLLTPPAAPAPGPTLASRFSTKGAFATFRSVGVGLRGSLLKGSISTPNLRHSAVVSDVDGSGWMGGGGGVVKTGSQLASQSHVYSDNQTTTATHSPTRPPLIIPPKPLSTPPRPTPIQLPPTLIIPPKPLTSPPKPTPIQTKPTVTTGKQAPTHIKLPTPTRTKPTSSGFVFPKGKDKWLSAETWCDALLFPRPRLRMRADPSFVSSTSSFLVGGVNGTGNGDEGIGEGYGGEVGVGVMDDTQRTSGRIVSPPGSPIGKADDLGNGVGEYEGEGVDMGHGGGGGVRAGAGATRGGGIGTGAAVMSRVLAHSRSLVDLRLRKKSTMEDVKKGLGRGVGYANVVSGNVNVYGGGVGQADRVESNDEVRREGERQREDGEKAARPRSFAQDDMALPTPVPSLDHVLRENAAFTTERAAWAQQAAASLGNKRARSVSRTRSKSLTQKGRSLRNPQAIAQSNLEYLAARACLGTQNLTPKVAPPKVAYLDGQSLNQSQSGGIGMGAGSGKSGHSHQNSLVKTFSGKSQQPYMHSRSQSNATHGNASSNAHGMVAGHRRSQSANTNGNTNGNGSYQGQQHSRGDSWSRSAVKMAKSTVGSCLPSINDPTISPALQPQISSPVYATATPHSNRGTVDLEGALKRDGTKVIRLADPAYLPAEVYNVPRRLTPSPSMSAHSSVQSHGHSHGGHLGVLTNNLNGNNNTNIHAGGNERLSVGTFGHAYAYASSGSGHGHDHESRMGIAIGGPSPTPSGMMEDGARSGGGGMGVGLGIGGGGGYATATTVDREAGMRKGEVMYVPGHPYAQGGFSMAQSTPEQATMGSNNAPLKEATKVPTIDEIITRHKAAVPHLPLHPYAAGAGSRDSYLDSYGMTGQFRHGAGGDPTKKMWAQLSPGGVQEILSPEIKHYSPYSNLELGSPVGDERGGRKGDGDGDTVDQRTIHDTVGVGEALVNATRARGAGTRQDVASGTAASSEGGPQPMPPPHIHLSHSITHTYAASPFHQDTYLSPDDADEDGQSISITPRSGFSSRFLGSPNDLEGFQDLFYKPRGDNMTQTPKESALPDTPGVVGGERLLSESPEPEPWNGGEAQGGYSREGSPVPRPLPPPPPIRRTDSGLTSLARQLNEEFEQIALEREQAGIRYSRTPSMSLSDAILHSRHGSLSGIAPLQPLQYSSYQHRRQDSAQTASGMSRSSSRGMTVPIGGEPSEMQFIFEEASSGTNADGHDEDQEEERMAIMGGPIQAFMPSARTLPEDVHSLLSRDDASSVGHRVVEEEEDDDPTAVFRVGIIGSVSTPPPVSPDHNRTSFNAEMHNVQEAHRDFIHPATRTRLLSGLKAPLGDMARSSYMTTSTLSRMSGLSDFPAPPNGNRMSTHEGSLKTPGGASLLRSYFDEALYQRETEDEDIPEIPRPPTSLLRERQLTFGGNQDADELVKSLSGGPASSGTPLQK